jgi:uncharacterized membrane-anchored protein
MVFCVVSLSHKYLRIDVTSKGIIAGIVTGIVTGIEVYALIFLPISMYFYFQIMHTWDHKSLSC